TSSLELLQEELDLLDGGLAARRVAGAGGPAVPVPVPDVDPLERGGRRVLGRRGPGAPEGGEGPALLVQIDRTRPALVPGLGRAAGARAVAHLGEDEGLAGRPPGLEVGAFPAPAVGQ